MGSEVKRASSAPILSLPENRAVEEIKLPFVLRIFSPLKTGAKWVWDVVVLRLEKDGFALLLLLLGALGIFPFWIGAIMAVAGIALIAFGNASSEKELTQLRKESAEWEEQREKLEQQLLELMNQRDSIRISHEVLGTQKTQTDQLLERVMQERGEFSAQAGQLKWDQTQLKREKGKLEESLEQEIAAKKQLTGEKGALEKEKKALDAECIRIMAELTALQLKQERSEGSQELQQHFAKFDAKRGDFDSLILSWTKRREQLSTMMLTAIAKLPENSPLRIAAKGITELSKEEGDWVQQMGRLLPTVSFMKEEG